MAGLSGAKAANTVDALLATAAFVASTAPIRCRLMTANGSATAAGTELVTSGGYTSGVGAPTIAFNATSTTTGQTVSNTAQTVTNMPATTIVGVELWTSDTTPVRLFWGPLTAAKTTNAGDTYSQAAGAIAVGDL